MGRALIARAGVCKREAEAAEPRFLTTERDVLTGVARFSARGGGPLRRFAPAAEEGPARFCAFALAKCGPLRADSAALRVGTALPLAPRVRDKGDAPRCTRRR